MTDNTRKIGGCARGCTVGLFARATNRIRKRVVVQSPVGPFLTARCRNDRGGYLVHSVLLIVFLAISAQGVAQVAVSSSGATISDASGEVSYTVGQTAYAEVESSSMMVYQGVQQPYCQPSYDTVRAVACLGSAYAAYGFDITEAETAVPGIYVFSRTLTNHCGCDSVLALQLTVKARSEESDSVAACDSYVWRGAEYTEGFDSVMVYTDMDGCDSVYRFRLTINHSSEYEFEVQSSYFYDWHSVTYSESGIYQQTLVNRAGCDSIVTLNLTIIDGPLPSIYTYDRRVLFVDHYPGNQQERVDYPAYRWYRDSVCIAYSGRDQYYEEGFPQLHGCYYVMVPADSSQTRWVKSNVICMDQLDIEEAESQGLDFMVAPNPVLSGHDLEVELQGVSGTDLAKIRVMLFDNAGRVLQNIAVTEPRFTMNMPYVSGYYTLYVRHEDGRYGVRKIVVHR